ncbi:Homeobox-leucine zipper protein [Musa troglodytarum]|uniref:Homeobox-leucine zipper protein n=1 Tax=Musa troglodytarum TaxID=320322 RepID=A0A9E7EZZ1_9LILI|nr:Homeobox-leucine zipper protein [Musa troglodytarum]URD86542.1 Homeobox-leucine zipper protein [Musa troglodytarum]URD86543.1 Homeobox-leucine zipper protein [Musa troglodytarum]
MSFGGLFDSGSGRGGGGARTGLADAVHRSSTAMSASNISQPLLASPSLPMFNSPGLSLTLQSDMEGKGAAGKGGAWDLDSGRQNKEDENESRSGGSDNLGGLSGDDLEQENPRKKKRYHRHTPHQIQELEACFKDCPHPDEKQRLELSKRLSLEARQVKFWFQNRRTQMKTQMERHENMILRQENDKLRAENLSIREATRNPVCSNCGGLAMLGEGSLEEQHLRIENARLKDELDRVCSLIGKFLGKPISALSSPLPLPISNSTLDLAVGNNVFAGLGLVTPATLPPVTDFTAGATSGPFGTVTTPARDVGAGTLDGVDRSQEKFVFLELALTAMDELVKMAQMEDPLWVPTLDGGKETLNYEEYLRSFPRCIGAKPVGLVSEATRATGAVIINSLALVDTLMDATRWVDMFPSVIARATTTDVLSSGMGGSRNGVLQLMYAELQVLSPLVPVRDVRFLRFCKQLTEGAWAVVDVSTDGIRDDLSAPPPNMSCRRLPSGCLVQDMPNGYSKVTWVEHAEYDEAAVHPLFRPLVRSGMALGAHRWVASLQRQCQSLAMLMSSSLSHDDTTTITPSGRRSLLKLAQRMTDNFCAGVCASSAHEWNKLSGGINIGEDVRVKTSQNVAEPGEPPGVVLSAATSVWLPIAPQCLFDFLRNQQLRSRWDILSNGGPMQEMAHISKGKETGNAISLLRASAVSADQNSMLILQETCTDSSGSVVVYAPVDVPAMHLVMSGGDSTYVALLPSGFAILPDGRGSGAGVTHKAGGSLLTVGFQILVNNQPTAKLTVESVETVSNLISCTVEKIKAAIHCEA